MRQRVSFLRTLLAGKPVLALDEPFAALDAITRQEMQGWLSHVLASEPRTVILVTHDVEEAVMLGDRVVVMSPRPGRAVVRDRRRRCPAPAGAPTRAVVELRERALAAAGGGHVRRMLRALPAALLLLALIGIWELYVDLKGADLLADPALAPSGRASRCTTTARCCGATSWSTAAGGAARDPGRRRLIGAVLSIAIHFSPTLRRATYPLIVASQAVPVAVFAPVLAFWLGFGILPKLVVVALVSFFSIVVTTTAGLDAVDPDLIKLMRTFDASRLATFRHVELPSALPCVFAGAKIAVAVSVIGAVFAEYTGSNSGLGYVILVSSRNC